MQNRERSRSRSPRRSMQAGFKLHVSNLPINYPQKNIQDAFSRYGSVEDIRIIRKGGNGQPLKESCYGFIVMTNEDEAIDAMKSLNQEGWTINLSKEVYFTQAMETQAKQRDQALEDLPTPSLNAFFLNAQATHLMLTNNAKHNSLHQMESQFVENLIADNHPSAFNLSGVPMPYCDFFLVREVWIGNISPSTEKKALYDAFKMYGDIEGIEMFSSKGFAFIKYRKVVSATLSYENAQGSLVDGRPAKVAFADPTRRIDIVGDSASPKDPNFNPIDDDNFKNLYLGYSAGAIVPSETKLRDIFSRYGSVRGVHVKQAQANMRPYAFVDFERGEQAALARKHLYIDDDTGARRAELGDPALEISFKNTNTIVTRNGTKTGPKPPPKGSRLELSEITKRLMQKPPELIPQPPQNGIMPNPTISSLLNQPRLAPEPPPPQEKRPSALLPAPDMTPITNPLAQAMLPMQAQPPSSGILGTPKMPGLSMMPQMMGNPMMGGLPTQMMPGQMPGPMSGPMPGQYPGQMPGQMPSQMPGQIHGHMQNQLPPHLQPQMLPQMNPYAYQPYVPSINKPPETFSETPSRPIIREEVDPNIGNVVWSGFMTRNKLHKVGLDATLVEGIAEYLSCTYHLSITHRVQFEEATKYKIMGKVTLEASNDLEQKEFGSYIKYFQQKQRGGYIPLKSAIMYILPPCEAARKYYGDLSDNQLLGLFIDPSKRNL